jgi:MFS family permease
LLTSILRPFIQPQWADARLSQDFQVSSSPVNYKRTALLLAVAQAILGSAAPIAISMGALAGQYLLGPDKSLATAPVTGFNVGVALGAIPAAWLLRTMGGKLGFMSGALITSLGGALAAGALFQGNFWFFVASLAILGLGGAFVQQIRFAAADNSPTAFKAQAISWVLGGGIISAVLGPQTVIFTREAFAPVMFAGAYAAIVVFGLLGVLVLAPLRLANVRTQAEVQADRDDARPFREIISQPKFIIALTCAVGSYALMSFVMTGAPLAMVGCGFSVDEATLGIQWHVLAMFGPSFFTGKLISRFGKEKIIATGLLILIACAIVALLGIELWNFWLSLILLGLGWNFSFIGATSLFTETYRLSEKGKVQGFHDFILFGSVALSSLFAGKILDEFGWNTVNIIIFPVVFICLAALATLVLRKPKPI